MADETRPYVPRVPRVETLFLCRGATQDARGAWIIDRIISDIELHGPTPYTISAHVFALIKTAPGVRRIDVQFVQVATSIIVTSAHLEGEAIGDPPGLRLSQDLPIHFPDTGHYVCRLLVDGQCIGESALFVRVAGSPTGTP